MKNISKYLTVLTVILFVLTGCSEEWDNDGHSPQKYESVEGYELIYLSGNWEHPDYSFPFSTYGNHRIVVEVPNTESPVVQVVASWRRRDTNPEEKDIIVINAETGLQVKSYNLEVDNETGHILFSPESNSSVYHVYYLPHTSTGSYYPVVKYDQPAVRYDKEWLGDILTNPSRLDSIPEAKAIEAQSIDDFHSFFPMEVIATKEEVSDFLNTVPGNFYLFPEYRHYSIRMRNYLPYRWVRNMTPYNEIRDTVSKGEYYTFQIGVYSPDLDLEDLEVTLSDLSSGNRVIEAKNITCFNTEGVDLNGEDFSKKLDITAGVIQSVWIGIDIPSDAKRGEYNGYVIVKPKELTGDTIWIELKVTSNVLSDHGDSNPEMMTRLRWLNSKIGSERDIVIAPFEEVVVDNRIISILGRTIELNQFGMPQQITSFFAQQMTLLNDEGEEILNGPIEFEVITSDQEKEVWIASEYIVDQEFGSEATWTTTNSSDNFNMNISGLVEYDGMINYNIMLVAKTDIEVNDIKLNIRMPEEAAGYILGLGYKGGQRPPGVSWNWDIKRHQEGVWLGAVNKGLQYVLRDENYERPLNTNFYQDKPLNMPHSWYNNGKGGINITSDNGTVLLENHSGSRSVSLGDTLNFNIRFLITPFKLINIRDHFNTRFVHKYVSVDSVAKLNGTVVNVHHANEINPYINYPFYNTGIQKEYIDEAHSRNIKVKLYNTIRELSYKTYELFAMRSLGNEIFNDGSGGGHGWLQEHLGSGYYSAWHATRVNDAAILNKGNSRWTNYYIEGINWLARNQGIDGLYLDDIAFSRTTVKRIANVLTSERGSYIIDLHSANQFNNRDGFINSAFLYMEHFPYVSRLWFGEYFDYFADPEYWFTEVSGIPFGLTGEMLQDGGRPYHGLIYGMTTRVYGEYNPGQLWSLFDDFNISESAMLGYWVESSPIKVTDNDIKCTVYRHDESIMIVLASWSDKDIDVDLNINWDELTFDRGSLKLFSPSLEGMQEYQKFEIGSPIRVPAQLGLILILQ